MLWKTKVNCRVNHRHNRIACNMLIGYSQKACRKDRVLFSNPVGNQISTGGKTIPKAFTYGINLELGKPVFPLWLCSRSTARKAVGDAGRGSPKKANAFL